MPSILAASTTSSLLLWELQTQHTMVGQPRFRLTGRAATVTHTILLATLFEIDLRYEC